MKNLIAIVLLIILGVGEASAQVIQKASATSNVLTVKITDLDTGKGKTGLLHSTAGLIISARANVSSATTVYTQAASNIETITTLGTYAAPTASKIRFKEVDSTNSPGVYEFHPADALFAVANTSTIDFCFTGISDIDDPCVKVLISPSVNVASVDSGAIQSGDFAARGTAQAVTSTTIRLAASETFADNELINDVAVYIASASTGAGQVRCITGYTSATDEATVAAWTTTPTGTVTYDLVAAPNCRGDVKMISGDTNAADNAELFFDGTGYSGGTTKLTVNTTQWNGTNVATPHTNGYPICTIKDGTGTGEIDTNAGAVVSVTTATNLTNLPTIPNNWITAAGIATNALTSDELAQSFLAEFFTVDSGTTYASAVAGSVVKEMADNAGGSGLTLSAIADAVWDELRAGHAIAGSFGERVIADTTYLNGSALSGNNATLNLRQLNIVNSTGTAIVASSTGSNGIGIDASGNGSGAGLRMTGGATGEGMRAIGGATSGAGIRSTVTGGSLEADFDIAGSVGSIATDGITSSSIAAGAITSSEFTATPTCGGLNASALADLFDTNSGTTYASAVAGSVVKEIVDNVEGGGGGGGGDWTVTEKNQLRYRLGIDGTVATPSATGTLSPVTVGTNNDKTGYSIAGTKTRLDQLNDISVASIWNALLEDWPVANSAGEYLSMVKHYVANKWTLDTKTYRYSVKKDDGVTEYESGISKSTIREPNR